MPDQNRISAVLSPDERREPQKKLDLKTLVFKERCAGHMAAKSTPAEETARARSS